MNYCAVVWVLVMCSGVASGAEELQFAWPEDLQARVELAVQGTRLVPGEDPHVWDVSATFDLETEMEAELLLIHRRNFEGWKGTMPAKVTFVGDQLIDRVPVTVVTSDGGFVEIRGMEEARRDILASIDSFGGVASGQEALLANAITDAGLSSMCQDFWGTMVQAWLWTPLASGEMKQTRNRTQLPQIGGGVVDLIVEMRNLGNSSCPIAGCDIKCIKLSLSSQADPDQIRAIVASASGLQQLIDLTQELQASVLLDPRTMLPHHIEIHRENTITFTMENFPAPLTAGESSTRTYNFYFR